MSSRARTSALASTAGPTWISLVAWSEIDDVGRAAADGVAAAAAVRHPLRDQGQHRPRGNADHGGLPGVRVHAAAQRLRRRAADGGRRDPDRQDEHGPVRDGADGHAHAVRAHRERRRPALRLRRLELGLGRRRRRRHRAVRARHRHGRLGPDPGGVQRDRRLQAVGRADRHERRRPRLPQPGLRLAADAATWRAPSACSRSRPGPIPAIPYSRVPPRRRPAALGRERRADRGAARRRPDVLRGRARRRGVVACVRARDRARLAARRDRLRAVRRDGGAALRGPLGGRALRGRRRVHRRAPGRGRPDRARGDHGRARPRAPSTRSRRATASPSWRCRARQSGRRPTRCCCRPRRRSSRRPRSPTSRSRATALLGTYTNFVNLLDLCAVAVPAGPRGDGPPFGVSLIAPAGADGALMALATHWGDEHPARSPAPERNRHGRARRRRRAPVRRAAEPPARHARRAAAGDDVHRADLPPVRAARRRARQARTRRRRPARRARHRGRDLGARDRGVRPARGRGAGAACDRHGRTRRRSRGEGLHLRVRMPSQTRARSPPMAAGAPTARPVDWPTRAPGRT